MSHAAWERPMALFICLIGAGACSFDHVTGPGASRASVATARVPLALGGGITCGIATSGKAYCWGANNVGQAGSGLATPSGFPTSVASDSDFVAMSIFGASSCALTASGAVYCWGMIPDGAAAANTRRVPTKFASSVAFASLTVGFGFACGLDQTGRAFCWGRNNLGQLGVGDTLTRSAPTAVAGGLRFTEISAGLQHTCGSTIGGTAYCWGDNTFGEIGITSRAATILAPVAINTSVAMKSVSAGANYTCAISITSSGYCWGDNTAGELGDGTTHSRSTPMPIAGDLAMRSIQTSRADQQLVHTCGLTTSGAAYCWGANSEGETGGPAETACIGFLSAVVCNTLPVAVRKLGTVVAIEAGDLHSCAITTAGEMECWGGNQAGELGDGSRSQQVTPVVVAGGLRFH